MLLIQNAVVHTMEDPAPQKLDVLIRSGHIAELAPRITPDANIQIIQAQGLHLYPGFIDAHSHIGISEEKTGQQGVDCNESSQPVTPCMRAIDAINPMDSAFHNALAAGVTSAMIGPGSANAIGGQFAFLKCHGRRVDDMVVLSPAAIKIAFGENPKNCYGANGNMPVTRMGIAALIRQELFEAKQYLDSGSREDFAMECYRPLFEGRIPLKAHVHRADDICTAIRIAEEFGLSVTLDHCTEGHLIAKEIASSGFPAIVGPSLASRSKNEVCESDFKTAGILHKVGVTVALTTDHPVSRIQYLPLCAALAAKEGLGREAALRAITIDAARICRVDRRVGSILPGKDADLALWNGDPLTLEASVRMTLVNGAIAFEQKKDTSG